MNERNRKGPGLNIVVCGLSITSSWGNGHATTYRALLREMARRGHRITFLERDAPWYCEHRDLPDATYCRIGLYSDLTGLIKKYRGAVEAADIVIAGSYIPSGIDVIDWLLQTAKCPVVFYDIDTPVTVADIKSKRCAYLSPAQIPDFAMYLSFTGGPILNEIRDVLGAKAAHLLACSVDPSLYYPEPRTATRWSLGYLGTYSADRQPKLDMLLRSVAGELPDLRFAVAGSLYPRELKWPANVDAIEHLPPREHRGFYNAQRFTLNVTRRDMVTAGYSPSVRLFEAAACGTPIVSDAWTGLDRFFVPGEEILIAETSGDCRHCLCETSEESRRAIGERARARVMAEHTSEHRARQLETLLLRALEEPSVGGTVQVADRGAPVMQVDHA